MNRKTGVGTLLLRFAETTLHPVTVDRVVLPALADLQHECSAEGASVYTRVRAYGGVLKALAICIAGDAARDRDRHLAPLAVRLLAALAILVLLLTLPNASYIVRFGGSVGIGAAITTYLLAATASIVLALPCALFFALALHRFSDRQPGGRLLPAALPAVLVAAAVMVAMVTVLVPRGNEAWREYVVTQLRSQGHTVTMPPGLPEMTWTELNDRIRHPPSVRAEGQARDHRQFRIALVVSVVVLAVLGGSLAGRWRSRLGTLAAAVALLALYVFCFTHGWNNGGRPLAFWTWTTNGAFFVLGVGLIVSRVPRAAGQG
jgi:hypothetical protein